MKTLYLIFLGISIALITGCASASFTQTGETFAKYDGPVKVLTEAPEDSEYVEIGIVSLKRDYGNDADFIKALQKEAAKNGANAIILSSNRESPYVIGSAVGSVQEMTAIAIRIRN